MDTAATQARLDETTDVSLIDMVAEYGWAIRVSYAPDHRSIRDDLVRLTKLLKEADDPKAPLTLREAMEVRSALGIDLFDDSRGFDGDIDYNEDEVELINAFCDHSSDNLDILAAHDTKKSTAYEPYF